MSRIGKKPIIIEPGVTFSQKDGSYIVTGPKGTLTIPVIPGATIEVNGTNLDVKSEQGEENTSVMGLCRSLVQNAVTGVTKGWTKTLELVGVGFRAQTSGNDLVLNVGFSHQVTIKAPSGITFSIVENKITVSGADKYLVGEVAASVKRVKPPEPYKGKGIRYAGEVIRKKLGKAAKAVGGAPGAK
jgi:large subunit ribosomal protein L6